MTLSIIFIRQDFQLYRHIIGTDCSPLVADTVLFCYKMDIMLSLSDNYKAGAIEAYHPTSKYLDIIFNIDILFYANGKSDIAHRS